MQGTLLKYFNKKANSAHKRATQSLCYDAFRPILLTIGIRRNVNKKTNGKNICVEHRGCVSLQRHDKLLQTTTTRGWGDEFAE